MYTLSLITGQEYGETMKYEIRLYMKNDNGFY